MLGRSVKTARLCGAGIALSFLLSGGAYAADLDVVTKAPPATNPYADIWTRPYLFGDLGRSYLHDLGIDWSLTMVNETVGNVSGGTKTGSANAGQLAFQALFDMGKLANINGGSIGLGLVQRWGRNLNADDNIPASMLTDEVFGRGNVLRLMTLYYDQTFFNGFLDVKGGYLPVGNDFFFGKCEFINLTFCGGQPGNIVGNYIYNWPVSQLAGVVKLNLTNQLQFKVGVYDANPDYLNATDPNLYLIPSLPASNPASGTMVPVELMWSPSFGRLEGVWRIGGWYDNASTIDGGLPNIVASIQTQGGTFDIGDQRGRYGIYESILQRLTAEGPGPQGCYAFLNTSWADHRTSFNDYQSAIGVKHTGTFASRPDDEIAFAVGTTHTNSAAIANPNAGGNEVPIEAWYGWQATGWLNLKFDAQYVINPGGKGYTTLPNGEWVHTDNAWVFGLRTTVKF
jgi:porin